MTPLRIKYLVFDPDSRGNERYYVRRKVDGTFRKVRIAAAMPRDGSPDEAFIAAYWAALAELAMTMPHAPAVAPREETFSWLWEQYQRSDKWQALDPLTKYDKRIVLGPFFATAASLPFRRFRKTDVEAVRDKKAKTPAAADKLVKYLRALFTWAIAENHVEINPATGVRKLNSSSKGWHSWTATEVAKYRETHAPGTRARFALELMFNTGARVSDACRLGRQHEIDGGLKWTAWKNRARSPVAIEIPMRPELRRALAITNQVGDLTYLITSHDTPFTPRGLGNKMREWCDEAGLPNCSAHGLRKAAANELADNGATAVELMAIFGWTRIETAEAYVRAADKRRRSANAFARLDDYRKSNSVSLLGPKRRAGTKSRKRQGKSNG
ncbi:MAG: site-specific integrase [Devosia sp.]